MPVGKRTGYTAKILAALMSSKGMTAEQIQYAIGEPYGNSYKVILSNMKQRVLIKTVRDDCEHCGSKRAHYYLTAEGKMKHWENSYA